MSLNSYAGRKTSLYWYDLRFLFFSAQVYRKQNVDSNIYMYFLDLNILSLYIHVQMSASCEILHTVGFLQLPIHDFPVFLSKLNCQYATSQKVSWCHVPYSFSDHCNGRYAYSPLNLWNVVKLYYNMIKFYKVWYATQLGPLLLTWINFNPSMDK